MKKSVLRFPLALAAVAAVALVGRLRAEEVPTTIKFSDASKPGTVKVILAHGDLRITGTDAKGEVTVKTDSKTTSQKRKDGMRVLTASASYSLTEKDNIITLDAMAEGWGGGSADFRLTVPRNTSVSVSSKWGGDVTATNISGDIDISSMNGEIRLDEIAGGVAVETMNGEIRANIRELHTNKPLSFTSTNGEVVVRVLPEAKANISLRTQNGSVLTDFDEQVLVTKTETFARPASARRVSTIKSGVIPAEARAAIADAARAVAQAGAEIKAATREGLEAARYESDRARAESQRAEAERQVARAEAQRAEAERRTRTASTAPAAPATPATPPSGAAPAAPAAPPAPALPTISGGKLVTGTLNGGGPEISIRTMNGDVTLRKWDPNAPTTGKRN